MRRIMILLLTLSCALWGMNALAQSTLGAESPSSRSLIEAMQHDTPQMNIVWQMGDRWPAMITGMNIATDGDDPQSQALDFVARWSNLIGLSPGSLVPVKTRSMTGRSSVQLQQMHDGLPVIGRYVVITLDDAGVVRAVASDAIPFERALAGDITEAQAQRAAVTAVLGEGTGVEASSSPIQRVIVADPGLAVVAWKVGVPGPTPLDAKVVLVDSRDGRILQVRSNVMH